MPVISAVKRFSLSILFDNMENFADQLIATIRRKNSCVVVGLDPYFKLIPDIVKQKPIISHKPSLEYAARVILEFNMRVIDLIAPHVGIVKPQIAFTNCMAGGAYGHMQKLSSTPNIRD